MTIRSCPGVSMVWSKNSSQPVAWIRSTVLMEVRVVSPFRTGARTIPSIAPFFAMAVALFAGTGGPLRLML